MKIAIIGAGKVGKALGTALRARAHTVTYGTRDPARSTERNSKPVSDALQGAEAVILATPWSATEALVCEHADGLAGKIVIDATNPINPSLTRLSVGFDTSGAELLQGQARRARFFKTTRPALAS
jgi:predicted dinucleotide-binding enzyme